LVPTAHQAVKVHLTRVRPPATFRPQGLVTLATVYSLHSPADCISNRRRSWDSPLRSVPLQQGIRTVTSPDAPTYRFSPRCSRRQPSGRTAEPRFLGFDPCRSPSRTGMRLTNPSPDAPLRFTLPGFCQPQVLPELSFEFLSFTSPHSQPKLPSGRRFRVSINPRLATSAATPKRNITDTATLLGFLCLPIPDRLDVAIPGLCVHLLPRRTLLPTARQSLEIANA
jgi:hypothetical protein